MYALLAGRSPSARWPSYQALLAAVGRRPAVGLLAGLSGAMCGALLQTQADPAYLGRVTAVA